MGFLDELKDKAEEVIENVKDRFDGDDDTPTLSDESIGYSGAGAEDMTEAVAATGDTARSSYEDGSAAAQENTEGIGEPPLEATEPAASSVDEALGAQEASEDRQADSV